MKYDYAVTVTGAAGFVGSNLVRALLESEPSVRIFAIDRPGADWSRLADKRLYGGEPRAELTIEEYDAHQPIHSTMLAVDSFYHFAGIANPQVYLEDPLTVMSLNLDGLRNVLERICLWSSHRPRIVYSSTSEVYGKNPDVPWREDADCVFGNPRNQRRWCYAMTKAVGEHYLHAYRASHGIQHTIFRFFNFVGNDIDAPGLGRAIPKMVGDFLDHGECYVTPPGYQSRCFTHIDDVVEPLVNATFFKPSHVGQSYTVNLGTDEETTIVALVQKIATVLVNEGLIDVGPKITMVDPEELFGKKGYEDVPRRVPDIGRARQIFAWEPRRKLDDFLPGIVKAIAEKHLHERGDRGGVGSGHAEPVREG